MNKKIKKLNSLDLPSFADWENAYYKKHPAEIALLQKELADEFNHNPDMPLEVLLGGLRRIAELYGIARLARETKLNRENLYKSLSPKGNPTIHTLGKVAAQLGYRLTFTPITRS